MKLIFACLLSLIAFFAQATPTWSSWPEVGHATLTWGPFDVYHSQLSTPEGHYQAAHWPQALSIEYLRSISREELVKATDEQWDKLGLLPKARQNGWSEQAAKVWPDVSEGSQITFLADADGGQFYYRAPHSVLTEPLGPRFSADFRDAFLAIWLSPTTQYPDLRKDLIGGTSP